METRFVSYADFVLISRAHTFHTESRFGIGGSSIEFQIIIYQTNFYDRTHKKINVRQSEAKNILSKGKKPKKKTATRGRKVRPA